MRSNAVLLPTAPQPQSPSPTDLGRFGFLMNFLQGGSKESNSDLRTKELAIMLINVLVSFPSELYYRNLVRAEFVAHGIHGNYYFFPFRFSWARAI